MCWARKVLELSSAMVEMVVLFSRRYAGYAGIGLLRRQRSNMHLDQTGYHATPALSCLAKWSLWHEHGLGQSSLLAKTSLDPG